VAGVNLNLGCCDRHLGGFVNVDIVPPADKIADLRVTWPWPDSSVDSIRADDIVEHLPDKIHTMNEAWRVLKPGGRIMITVPTTDGRGAWQDPQHCSYWNRNSFFYYEHGNPHLTRFAKGNGVKAAFRVLAEHSEALPDSVVKLTIVLEAVK